MEKSTEELLEILKNKKTIEDYFVDEVNELVFSSLGEYLDLLINEKKLRKSDVIRKSNLDKNYAYQIFNGNKLNPSRNKMIMLSFGMGLSVSETRKLLKIANVSDLYPRSPRDSVIIYCLNKGMDLIGANELLNDYKLEILE